MSRVLLGVAFSVLLCGWCVGQVETVPPSDKGPGETQAPPRSDRNAEAEESSSRDTRIDLSPPKDDAKNHPYSRSAVADAGADPAAGDSDVQEFHPWDPHKAAKDIEVGDFYFKRKNFRAALDRYQEALYYKDNDAVANYRIAQCFEKLDKPEEARNHYEAYLKILPHGEFATDSEKRIEKLKGEEVPEMKK